MSYNSDRFLDQVENAKRQKRHLERLRTMQAAIDNKTDMSMLAKHDIKKEVRKREKADQIYKENIKILNKITNIVSRENNTFHSAKDVKTHATVNRTRDNERIDRENRIMGERLKTITAKSVYSREEFAKQRKETEQHMKRISHTHMQAIRQHYIHKFLGEDKPTKSKSTAEAAVAETS